jgi:hypothetical protein
MEIRFYIAMAIAGVALLCCASKKTIPIAMVLGVISVYLCCSITPELISSAG